MNKLIKLLRKFDEWWNWRKLHWIGLWCEDHDTIWYKNKRLSCEQDEIISYLISKSYGFIKRLVDNDKIDLWLYREYMPNLWEDFSVESNIIMNLSIAIDPIWYLNYILK